jgi:hypothetical protein
LNPKTAQFMNLVRKKINIPGNDPPDFSDERLSRLTVQLNARLKPVLRTEDFNRFDLRRSIEIVRRIGHELSPG